MSSTTLAPIVGSALPNHFTWIDWSIVIALLLATTLAGKWLAGRQESYRDFFRGSKALPWWAVSASIVSAQLSGRTFIAMPFLVFQGNFTYFMLPMIGALLSRFIVAFWLMPIYYAREIYSPFDFIGQRLGMHAKKAMSVLFMFGCLLGEASQLYLTAVLVQVLLQGPLGWFEQWTGMSPVVASIWLIGIVSVAWAMLGGITTVVWTDVIMTTLFTIGAIVALATVALSLPGGVGEMASVAWHNDKLTLWNFNPSFTQPFTFWAALFASTFSGIGALGTNHENAQRLFCCKNANHAKLAIILSWTGIIVPLSCMLIGAALFAYYQRFPLTGEAAALVQQKGEYIFPVFVATAIPVGIAGLVVASVIAAAVPTSALAALAQTTVSLLGGQKMDDSGAQGGRRAVNLSRWMIAVWGVLLCVSAISLLSATRYYKTVLDLIFTLGGYTGGALMAGLFLALFARRTDGSGYLFSAPLSVLVVFAVANHNPLANDTVAICGAVLVILWIVWLVVGGIGRFRDNWHKTIYLTAGACGAYCASRFLYWGDVSQPRSVVVLAFPWYPMIGAFVAFAWGWLLAGRTAETLNEQEEAVEPAHGFGVLTPGPVLEPATVPVNSR